MVVRAEVIRAKVAHLRTSVARLQRLLSTPPDGLLRDADLQWAVERGAQVAAEAVFDIGNHVLAGAFDGHAEEYRDVVPRLARHGVVAAELAAKLEGLAGLRNLIVHGYADVDPGRLHDDLSAGLGSLEDFAAAIATWVEEQPSP